MHGPNKRWRANLPRLGDELMVIAHDRDIAIHIEPRYTQSGHPYSVEYVAQFEPCAPASLKVILLRKSGEKDDRRDEGPFTDGPRSQAQCIESCYVIGCVVHTIGNKSRIQPNLCGPVSLR